MAAPRPALLIVGTQSGAGWSPPILRGVARFVSDLPARWLTEHADALDEPWEPFLCEDDDHDTTVASSPGRAARFG